MSEPSVKAISAFHRAKHSVPHALSLCFQDFTVEVNSNSSALIDTLRDYFKDFVVGEEKHPVCTITAIEMDSPELGVAFVDNEPESGKANVKEQYCNLGDGRIVRKKLTGMVFVFGNGDNLAIGPCIDNPNQVINFINNRFIQWALDGGCLLGHAAAVSLNGAGLALAGFSGMGKSTLSLSLMSRGVTFVSNDRVMVFERDGILRTYGVAKLPRINPGTIINNSDLFPVMSEQDRMKYSGMSGEELWNIERKYDVFIDRCFGKDRFILESRLDGLVILNWRKTDQPAHVDFVNIDTRRDLLPAFMKSPGLFFDTAGKRKCDFSEDAYVRLLNKCKVMEITGGVDFDFAADVCMNFLYSKF